MIDVMERTAATAASPKVSFGPAWHRRVGGLHVLKLKGSFYEMGRQHGTLLRDAIPGGPIGYFKSFVARLVADGNPAVRAGVGLAQRVLGRSLARKMPPFVHESLRGLADGCGVPYEELLAGSTMPDALLWVVARGMRYRGIGRAVDHRTVLGLGCTSAIAWGEATSDGKLYHARNLDYHGVSSWPRSTAVVFHEPDEGQRYVSVSAAGVLMGGFTAMNESGLTLTVHQHMFTDRTALGGTPIGIVGDVVMREARSLDDAERILKANTPVGCWTYLVADGKGRQLLCHEENPERHASLRTGAADTTFGYANVYLDAPLGATEKALYGSYWRHNMGRHLRANELLREGHGRHDAASMAGILADRGDPRCRVRNSIGMLLTVASVVFRPEDGTFWVGDGEAPTSRSTFRPFSLATEDHAPDAGEVRVEDGEAPADRDAFEHLRRAYIAYLDDRDMPRARAELDAARALAPSQPVYHALAGMLALQTGDPAVAEAALTTALGLGHPDAERVAGFHLWRARSRDVTGRRQAAIEDYQAALARPADLPVRKAATRGLKQAWKSRRFAIDLGLGDVIAP